MVQLPGGNIFFNSFQRIGYLSKLSCILNFLVCYFDWKIPSIDNSKERLLQYNTRSTQLNLPARSPRSGIELVPHPAYIPDPAHSDYICSDTWPIFCEKETFGISNKSKAAYAKSTIKKWLLTSWNHGTG